MTSSGPVWSSSVPPDIAEDHAMLLPPKAAPLAPGYIFASVQSYPRPVSHEKTAAFFETPEYLVSPPVLPLTPSPTVVNHPTVSTFLLCLLSAELLFPWDSFQHSFCSCHPCSFPQPFNIFLPVVRREFEVVKPPPVSELTQAYIIETGPEICHVYFPMTRVSRYHFFFFTLVDRRDRCHHEGKRLLPFMALLAHLDEAFPVCSRFEPFCQNISLLNWIQVMFLALLLVIGITPSAPRSTFLCLFSLRPQLCFNL
eukprot:g47571.t1